MNSRPHLQPFLNNSLAIRQEIQRFESVHPSIYALYDLIDAIPDGLVAQQIRDHVVCIEDSFVNSQEWTLSRAVPDLRLGIVGSLSSGKSALVHRYLTGSYMQEESPEGGRFKKEILLDNQSYLLLIRDEGGPPELQFTAWVDAVIFVFSLENESSFNAIYNYYTKMSHYRNSAEIPVILVGTQDGISESNPRVIDDNRARKLANDLKRCSYYETCATYGLNVERVFQDACQKIVQQRLTQSTTCLTPTNSRPSTPNNHFHPPAPLTTTRAPHIPPCAPQPNNGHTQSTVNNHHMSPSHNHTISHKDSHTSITARQHHTLNHPRAPSSDWSSSSTIRSHGGSSQALAENNNHPKAPTEAPPPPPPPHTPSSTPTAGRRSRRRSNLFTPGKKGESRGGDFGSGRAIPLKQGYLYKRSSKPLNKEWKKKYVTCDDGRLTYHPSLHDYMDDVHGKEISLQYVTVKVPGQKPRGSKSIITVAGTNGTSINDGIGGLSINNSKDKRLTEKVLLSAFEVVKDPNGRYTQVSGDEGISLSNNSTVTNGDNLKSTETPNVKKRHRRMKSSGVKNSEYDDPDGYEFYIVSLDNKQWHFEASSCEERDEWVAEIEQQILNSLQLNDACKGGKRQSNPLEAAAIQSIRTRVPGNGSCVDCDANNPDWASLNLGVLMCIECSGIHRNLGSHISRVRSLDLDEWPPGHLAVMLMIGNTLSNSIYHPSPSPSHPRPSPTSTREERERYIRAKYERREMVPPLQGAPMTVAQQLVDAVCGANVKAIVHVLAVATPEEVNGTVGERDRRTPLHLACALGDLGVAQLLIWHNANIKAVDQDGRTCLTYARAAASIATNKIQGGSPDSDPAVVQCRHLIDLLLAHGCVDQASALPQATLPRRRGSQPLYEKLPSSVV